MGLNFDKQTNNLINSFVSKENDKIRLFIVIVVAFFSGFQSFFLGLNDVTSLGSNLNWQDPFHFGEAFAASMGYIFSSQTAQYSQYKIHGAWDVLPTIISLAALVFA